MPSGHDESLFKRRLYDCGMIVNTRAEFILQDKTTCCEFAIIRIISTVMATRKKLSPGTDVLSYCGVCKMILNHVIVSVKESGAVGHCECLTCHARHPYRDPEQPVKRTATPSKRAVSIPVEQLWEREIRNAEGPSKPYSITESFDQNDLIEHPKFGKGLVKKIMPDNKMEVLFESDLKILVHANKSVV